MAAWDYTSQEITAIGHIRKIQAVFFDERCVVTSGTAMNAGPNAWVARPHSGTVTLPDGQSIPSGVISFAMGGENTNFFVMSTPSVWRAAGKGDNGLGSLETLMVAVVLHEGTHVAQMPTYGRRMELLSTAHQLPESFNDDSIQERFGGTPEFARSVAREIDGFLGSAIAQDDRQALELAREARGLMNSRQERWYRGGDAYLAQAEDIWLSLEGSAQWAAYQWIIDPRGGKVDSAVALASFGRRGKWWSQEEGFALFLALDRLSSGRWKHHAFGDGAKTVLQMLDEAIAGESATDVTI